MMPFYAHLNQPTKQVGEIDHPSSSLKTGNAQRSKMVAMQRASQQNGNPASKRSELRSVMAAMLCSGCELHSAAKWQPCLAAAAKP